jgi:hypothetical protein
MLFQLGIDFAHGDSLHMKILRLKPLRSLLAACLALTASASAFAQAAAAAPAAPPPAPTLEQRVAGLEAYVGNGDPAAALKTPRATSPPASRPRPSARLGQATTAS